MLRPRQRDQLHSAIFLYLQSNFPETAQSFLKEADLNPNRLEAKDADLELKWTAGLRLQLRLRELEKQLDSTLGKLSLHESASKYRSEIGGIPEHPHKLSIAAHLSPITAILFHDVFQYLISASEDGLIKVWKYELNGQLEKTMVGHTDTVNDIAIDGSGKKLASCSSDLTIKLWSFITGECLRTLYGHDAIVSCVRFLNSGDGLLSCSKDQTIRLWELSTGYCQRTFTGHADWVRSIAIPPYESKLRLFASTGNDRRVLLWSLQDSAPKSQILAHAHVIECAIFAPLKTLQLLYKAHAAPAPLHAVYKESLDSDRIEKEEALNHTSEYDIMLKNTGMVLFTASRDKTIKMWDCTAECCMKIFEGHDNWVRSIVCDNSGEHLFSCSDDNSIRVWDILSGSCLRILLKAHGAFVTCLSFHENSSLLASGSMDCTIRIWECRLKNEEAH